MLYQISRNGQMYGPYTLEDLQRYVTSGNVLPTDLAKSEEMADWVPVSQVLGTIPTTPPTYAAAGGAYGAVAQVEYGGSAPYQPAAAFPDPPNLHWGLMLLLGFLTCGIFMVVYELMQALWVKKVMPGTKVVTYYLAFLALEVVNLVIVFSTMATVMHSVRSHEIVTPSPLHYVSNLLGIGIFILVMLYRFGMRSDLEAHFNGPDPVGLRLSGVMTFFFGGLYFQYHFNRINEYKRVALYQGMR